MFWREHMHLVSDMPGDPDLPGYVYLRPDVHGLCHMRRHTDMRVIDLRCEYHLSRLRDLRCLADVRSVSDVRRLRDLRRDYMRSFEHMRWHVHVSRYADVRRSGDMRVGPNLLGLCIVYD